MPRRRLRPEEIIAKLREADVLLGQGKRVAEVVKALGVAGAAPELGPPLHPNSASWLNAVEGLFAKLTGRWIRPR
jgi:hypothetical protein